MSFVVGKDRDTLSVNTLPCFNKMLIAGKEIDMEDFRHIVNYVMCNSEMTENDPRLELLKDMQCLVVQEIRGQKRLVGHRPITIHFCSW